MGKMGKLSIFCCFGGKNAQGGERNDGDGDQSTRNDEPEASNQQLEEAQSSTPIINTATEPIIFTYSEIETATNNFNGDPLEGLGHFGPVFKGTLETTGQQILVKRINNPSGMPEFQEAINKLWRLRHPNILELIGGAVALEDDLKLAVYQFMPMTSLESHLHGGIEKRRAMNWETRMKIAAGVAEALKFLHTEGFVLIGGLKSSSILLDSSFKPRICDLGLLRLDMRFDGLGSTSARLYYAPEWDKEDEAKTALDVYCFGVFLFELISACNLVDITREDGIIDEARRLVNEYDEPETIRDAVVDAEMDRDFSVIGLSRAVKLGLHCVKNYPCFRPEWDYVLDVLKNNTGPRAGEASTSTPWSRTLGLGN